MPGAHRRDRAGSSADYGRLTALCLAVADRHAGGRLGSVLEGGYHLGALGASSAAHVAALLGMGAERP